MPVREEISFASSDGSVALMPGERALHIAAENGSVEIVHLLLKGSRADPNVMDNRGLTPLIVTCQSEHVRVEVVRLLLEAGADPTLADNVGFSPLHAAVAYCSHMDLVDMLYSRAPSALNSCTTNSDSPLSVACSVGHESMVSKLLSLGAIQPPDRRDNMCPLAVAAVGGYVGVVKILINEGGMRAIGGRTALPKAIYLAIRFRHAEILRLLLAVDGEERRSEWANTSFRGKRVLHFAAGYYYPAAVSALLEAGADEAARDSGGRIPRDVFGVDIGLDGEVQVDRVSEVAIRRMLHRGPAYRARSWAWPSDEEADPGGSGDGATAAAAVAAAVPSSPSPLAGNPPPVIGVRIFRPKEKSSSKLFMRVVGRYCAKD